MRNYDGHAAGDVVTNGSGACLVLRRLQLSCVDLLLTGIQLGARMAGAPLGLVHDRSG
jgi:hypothetical protein